MLHILYLYHHSKLPDDIWNDLFQKLPGKIQSRINRYVRWQDRQSRLFGHLLLLKGLGLCGYGFDRLDNINYSSFGRPYLDDRIDFNVSHSGSYVICAITDYGSVGIDIEEIKPLDLDGFRNYMKPEEWSAIGNSNHQVEKFFEYWTQKESVIKANGMGLSIPIQDIHIKGNTAFLYSTKYFLKELKLDPCYKCHMATDLENPEINITEIGIGKIA